ncbi:ROK family protein (plasmid) [Deinococcus sp. KNUC1210]|uniref:ROK family protein n=1 Tax=Deinococcus sp. KNUC1210 TaxID=2917691 RepID=UPI001EEF9920|nr:ROK family protein [Deinococcus sp. KNUC1210]ULH18371.1 ROK family protein [Deinococcus sp. KNUC1210]
MQMLDILTLDIGGSHVTAARFSTHGSHSGIGPRVRLHLDEHASADELLDTFAHAALAVANDPRSGVVARGDAVQSRLAAIGIGMPGPFDYEHGIGQFTGKFRALNGVDVGAGIMARLPSLMGLPLAFLNDAAAFALGEAVVHDEVGRILGVTLGTGLGSGFVESGRIQTAGKGVAREGQIGWEPYLDATAEDYVSTRRLISDYADLSGKRLRPIEISLRAQAGEAHAEAVFAAYGHHLGAVLAEWFQAYSPVRIVLGGNLGAARAHFMPALEEALRNGLGGFPCPHPVFSPDGERAALIGAAWKALLHEKDVHALFIQR